MRAKLRRISYLFLLRIRHLT